MTVMYLEFGVGQCMHASKAGITTRYSRAIVLQCFAIHNCWKLGDLQLTCPPIQTLGEPVPPVSIVVAPMFRHELLSIFWQISYCNICNRWTGVNVCEKF